MRTPLRSAVLTMPSSSKRFSARDSRSLGLCFVTWTRISPEGRRSAPAIAFTIRSESKAEKNPFASAIYQLPEAPPPPNDPPPPEKPPPPPPNPPPQEEPPPPPQEEPPPRFMLLSAAPRIIQPRP